MSINVDKPQRLKTVETLFVLLQISLVKLKHHHHPNLQNIYSFDQFYFRMASKVILFVFEDRL